MKLLKMYLIIGVAAVVYYAIFIIFEITCPIKHITGVPCPTCGMTRAMLALIELDIKGYMEYNPMSIFMFTAVFLFLHRDFLKKKKWIEWYMTIVLLVNSIVYISQLLKKGFI